ncbi:MAG TPA: hypothetical protein VHH90_07185 [Polyangia bacterium]|nr:hypothetical protein [Polyangia bacterium]
MTIVGAVGCGSGRVETIWVAGAPETVPAGVSACVEGPYASPSGASIEFDISDYVGDDMDVSVVVGGGSCDATHAGIAPVSDPNWNFRTTQSTGPQPAGYYELAISCYNIIDDCVPDLHSFGYVE